MDENLKQRLLSSKENADREIAKINAAGEVTEETVYRYLRPYILYKFLLDGEERLPEDFTGLVKLSIARTAKIDPALLKDLQRAQKCTSASSVAIKKGLLFLDIQRQLGITFDPEKTTDIGSLRDLARLVFDKLQEQKP